MNFEELWYLPETVEMTQGQYIGWLVYKGRLLYLEERKRKHPENIEKYKQQERELHNKFFN